MDHKFEIDSDSAPNGNFTDTNGHNTPTPSASSNGSQPNGHTSQGMPPFTPIAICGMACRLPGGIASPQELWEFLEAKGDARSRVPDSRYNIDTYHSPSRKPGTVISEHGYFLDESVDLGVLDTSLFSGPRKELERLDPQQRLLLEVAREALDDSGEVGWKGSNMGVYVGSYGQDWYDLFHRETQSYGYEISVTNDFMISSRLSYEMDLHGPSMTIRTACSSSLIGLNEACMAIAKGDCTSAIIGGTSILLAPSLTAVVSEQAALGADGSCKTFSSAADGYVRGEAIVAIYVKSLAEALRDGNPIRAVVVGSATNSDGKTPGFSAPSMTAQEALIRHTYKVAGISESEMAKTGFFECHGTGTSLGDPTEAGAVARVFGDEGIHIGSIKPNLGHSEGASGLTAVLKAVLALEHRVIPPNIKALPLNPKIPFESAHLTVPIDSTPWPADRYERVSVNSFGVGGSNAHVIIDSAASFNVSTISRYEKDEPVKAKTATLRGTPHLLVYSASSRESLAALTARYEAFMHEHADTLEHILLDLAYTLANRREHLLHRAFAVATADRIGVASLPSAPRVAGQAQAPSVVMVFTGQGAQWPQMGRELVKTNTVFKDTIRSLDQHLQACHASTWTIEEELLKPAKTSRVNEAEFSQPLCTALQIALVDSLKSVGIQPAAVVGHSSGEIAAAYAAGGLTREEAMSVAFCRGTATKQQIRVGAMAAIGLGWDETTKFLVPGVLMACDNSPKSVTLSGDAELLVNVVENIKNAKPGVLVSMLKVDKAYHSHHMVEVGDAYYAAMTDAGVVGRATSIPFFSSVTGQLLAPEADDALDPKYWQANLESPVRFNTAVSSLLQGPDAIRNPVLLEISAHPALAGPLRQIVTHTASTTVQVISTLTRRQNDIEGFLTAVGKLYTQNVVVDLSAIMPTGICLPSLPSMPWHHPRRYWYETRVSKEWRLRAHPYHDLLGIQVLESTALNPVWRNLFHLDNAPWVRDHKIDNEVVFPFAGYIAMAAEAILQVTGIRDGVSLQHVAVSTALVMSEEKPTELITTLHRRRLTDKQDSSWWEFTITSHNGHSWTKHCVGEVRAEESSVQPSLQRLGFSTTDQSVLPRKLSMRKWYSYLRSHGQGIDFGPHFTTLENARSSTTGRRDGTATMKNNVHGDDANYHLHPAIVDGFLQLLGFASRYGLTHDYPLVVPTSVERMTIFRCTDEHIDLAVSADVLGERVLGEGSCVANSQTIMSVSGVSMAALDPLDDYGEIESGILPTTAQCEWVRHPDFVDINALIELFPDYRRQHDSAPALDELAQLAIALSQQSARSLERSTCSHLKKYQAWLDQQDSMSLGSMDRTTLQAQISSLVDLLASSPIAPAAIAISKVCMHAGQILSGEMEPWEIMSADDILKLDAIMKSYDTSSFLRCLGQSKPNLRVLELGAGSSTATEGILKDLTRVDGQALYSQYVCVNVSYGIVEIIKTSLSKAHPKVEFVQCDIADELALESFEGRQFDLIIASGVIYTTSSIQRSFKNVRELLSPSGRLLLHEPLPGQQWTKYVSGILPSWWCGSEDGRYDEPYLSPERWEEELIAAGFGSVDVVLPDPSDNVFRLSTMMVAKPKRSQEAAIKKKVTLLYSAESIPSGPFAKELEAQGYDIHRCTIGEALPLGQDVISLLDAEKPFFDGIDSAGFEQFQKLVENLNVNRSGLLWVTQSSQAQHPDPRYALIHGLSRSIRSEMAIDFATCEVDDFASSTAARALVDIFTKYSERQDDGLLGPDYEYAISSGMTFVNRLFPVSFRKESLVSEPSDKSILQMSQLGRFSSLHWSRQPILGPVGDELEIEVYAAGLNFRDIMVAMGIIELPTPLFGFEAAGVVSRIGPDVKNFTVGDRTVLLGVKTFSTVCTATEKVFEKIPGEMSFIEGASMPLVILTAIYSLIDIGHLEKGQSILIHSGCGGVGLAAIQIARMLGAEIYTTVSSDEKVKYLMEAFDLPRNRILNSRSLSFADDLMRETNGKGVNLVLNSLSGEYLHASWHCVAKWGTMVEIGKRDFLESGKLEMDVFLDNRSYTCVDMDQMCTQRPHIVQRLLQSMVNFLRDGHIKPLPIARIFKTSEVEEMFRDMQKGSHIGKFILELRSATGTPLFQDVPLVKRSHFQLDSTASYLLIGGLGGLGRSISVWMVQHGARNLTFLSRSAGSGEHDQEFAREVESMGCTVQFATGSVTNPSDVTRAVDGMTAPLKGIIQMSMVLRDQAFPRMNIKEWNEAIEPKVQGTWNLHEVTRARNINLDFFLLFSSLSGIIGQPGQANYAAANTFLDAFVQYRNSLQLPCTAIDLGAVADAGYLFENEGLLKKMQGTGWRPLQEKELLAALHVSMQPKEKTGRSMTEENTFNSVDKNTFLLGIAPSVPLSDPSSSARMRRDVRMAIYHNASVSTSASSSTNALSSFLLSVKSTPSILKSPETEQFLAHEIGKRLNELLLKDEADIIISLGLAELGMDSLVAVEMRAWWKMSFRFEISGMEMLGMGSLEGLGKKAADGLRALYDV